MSRANIIALYQAAEALSALRSEARSTGTHTGRKDGRRFAIGANICRDAARELEYRRIREGKREALKP